LDGAQISLRAGRIITLKLPTSTRNIILLYRPADKPEHGIELFIGRFSGGGIGNFWCKTS
jgi:hypothetical protein